MAAVAPLNQVSLDDKYALEAGRVMMSGTQVLVRLPLLQRAVDQAAGLNTAGFVTGYRGSPLGAYDMELWSEAERLEAAHVVFQPGVNEDLAATAAWGTQQSTLLPGAKYDGVFAIWYGKGPGVDRSGDAFKHGNRQGASKHGGVLVCAGDDHPGKSSTVSHQSEQALAANHIPVLYPASVQELLDYGMFGWALSRATGLWVALKCTNETVEGTATIDVDPSRHRHVTPDLAAPPTGLNTNPRPMVLREADEMLVTRYRLPAALAFARANGIDRTVIDAPQRRLGIVATGKGYAETIQALQALGIDAGRASRLGLRLYKIGMIWPVEPHGLREFATGHDELLFVEEKASFVEEQAGRILYDLPTPTRPRITGKFDPEGRPLLPADQQLQFADVALAIATRLAALGIVDAALEQRVDLLRSRMQRVRDNGPGPAARTPYFCSGCPHNTSTQVPEGSLALAGIGCHTMAGGMNRRTLMPTQMGGEGLNWTGIAPFTAIPHVFQNLGDGTYFHSGLLAVRGAVAAGVNITYKVLYNDAVAMTGGQPVEGHLSPVEITRQLLAERVRRVVLVSDDPGKFRDARARVPPEVTVHHRDELQALQLELRRTPGVTAIVYEQTCAAEKRRRRKRGEYPDPPKRVVINDAVCEGCGDCSVQANCVSILPKETEFGRKREIDQSNCNKDYSCVNGFCPSFVTVHGGRLRKPQAATLDLSAFQSLPAPPVPTLADRSWNVLVAGIGGTGVVTVGSVLAMAAHMEGKRASVIDMTGLAQKNGAVWSHLRIYPANPLSATAAANTPAIPEIIGARVGLAEADLLLGCDLVTAAEKDSVFTLDRGRTRAVVNSWLQPTAQFQLDPNLRLDLEAELRPIHAGVGEDRMHTLDATSVAQRLLGNTIGANFLLVGYALQAGGLPVSLAAIERAIELNGQAVDFNKRALALGRLAAHDPAAIERLLETVDAGRTARIAPAQTLDAIVRRRVEYLTEYQDRAYAERYTRLVDRVRDVERERARGHAGLAEAVARNYFKLLAYKDEYEVARLHTSAAFREQVERTFEGEYELRFHLAPPLITRPDPKTGQVRKREFGPWMLPLFRLLARMKRLRGTAFDPFGRLADRRLERQLIEDYERLVDEIVTRLEPAKHATAVELASLPDTVRGFGHVKQRQLAVARVRETELLASLRSESIAPIAA
jgi:indolepyruvate ferredoxin oxidoreductase